MKKRLICIFITLFMLFSYAMKAEEVSKGSVEKKYVYWPENTKFLTNLIITHTAQIGGGEVRQSKQDMGLELVYNKHYYFRATTRQLAVLYEIGKLSRTRFIIGGVYDYEKGFVLPIGFNYDIGHWFGLEAYRVSWFEQLGINIGEKKPWYKVKALGKEKGNWEISFGLKINIH